MSMSSVSTPARLPSSWLTSRAACRLMRPILAVPRITGMNKGRFASMTLLLRERRYLHQRVAGLHAHHAVAQVLHSGLGRFPYGGDLELDDLPSSVEGIHFPFRGPEIGNSGFVVGDDLGMRQSEDARS